MNANDEVVLYFSKDMSAVIPMSTSALKVAQGNPRSIRSKNVGALLVQRNGRANIIESIDFVRYYGDTFLRRLISIATSAYSIRTVLKEVEVGLGEVKLALIKALKDDEKRGDPYFDSVIVISDAINRIEAASNVWEVFEALKLSDSDNALDVMC